jgi:hypothetical protein
VVPHAGAANELAWLATGAAALLLAAGMLAGSPSPVHAAVALLGAMFLARHGMRLLLAPPYGAGLLVMEDLAIQMIELRGVERIAADAVGARSAAAVTAAAAGACVSTGAALAVSVAPGRSVALTALGGVAAVVAFAGIAYLARSRYGSPAADEPST